MDPATAILLSAGVGAVGGAATPAPEQFPTYSAPGIPEQGAFIQQMIRSLQRGGGDFGFAPAARAGTSTLRQVLRDRGMPGAMGEGAGGSLFAQMLSDAMVKDAAGRRGFGLAASTAKPWVFNYQKKGDSPYGGFGGNWRGRLPKAPTGGGGFNVTSGGHRLEDVGG